MRKFIILLFMLLLITGCASEVDVEITNKTGHDEVYTILTYENGQDARDLNNNDEMHATADQGYISVSVLAWEYDDDYNLLWDYNHSKSGNVDAGWFANGELTVTLDSSGIIWETD